MTLQRLEMVADILNTNFGNYSIIDLGCRTQDLKPLLNGCTEYLGTDLEASPGVLKCDLENILPFKSNEYQISCALDVLEHLENPHLAASEIKRITREAVIISLPNIAHWSFRLNFLRTGKLSGKYTFHQISVTDRHRWVTNYFESKNFISHNFSDCKIDFLDIIPKRGRTRLISSPVEAMLAKLFPNVFVYGLIAFIRMPEAIK